MLCAAFFAWLVARQVRVAELQRAYDGARIDWIAAGFVAFCLGYAARIERWRLMVSPSNPDVLWRDCAGPFLASFAANNLLPFRVGDALRVFAFNRQLKAGPGALLATLLVERLLDLLMVAALLGSALAVFGDDARSVGKVGSAALIVSAGVILAVLFFPQLFSGVAGSAGAMVNKLVPSKGAKIKAEIDKIMSTLIRLSQGPTMGRLVSWSAVAWFLEGCVFYFAAVALPSIAAPSAAWLALPIGTLATLIPSTPGYVGTFDYFTVRAMVSLGNAASASTAFALLVHGMLWLPPTITGGLYWLFKIFHGKSLIQR
jgi:uncharacterized protein (TIRG00374 family)